VVSVGSERADDAERAAEPAEEGEDEVSDEDGDSLVASISNTPDEEAHMAICLMCAASAVLGARRGSRE